MLGQEDGNQYGTDILKVRLTWLMDSLYICMKKYMNQGWFPSLELGESYQYVFGWL